VTPDIDASTSAKLIRDYDLTKFPEWSYQSLVPSSMQLPVHLTMEIDIPALSFRQCLCLVVPSILHECTLDHMKQAFNVSTTLRTRKAACLAPTSRITSPKVPTIHWLRLHRHLPASALHRASSKMHWSILILTLIGYCIYILCS